MTPAAADGPSLASTTCLPACPNSPELKSSTQPFQLTTTSSLACAHASVEATADLQRGGTMALAGPLRDGVHIYVVCVWTKQQEVDLYRYLEI